MGREHGTIEGRLSVLMIALPLLTRRPDNYSQSDKDGGNCGKDSQSDQRHPSAVIASITLSYAWPNLDILNGCANVRPRVSSGKARGRLTPGRFPSRRKSFSRLFIGAPEGRHHSLKSACTASGTIQLPASLYACALQRWLREAQGIDDQMWQASCLTGSRMLLICLNRNR
jgi:hypothetical protein